MQILNSELKKEIEKLKNEVSVVNLEVILDMINKMAIKPKTIEKLWERIQKVFKMVSREWQNF